MVDGWDLGNNFCLFICFHYRQMKHLERITNKMLEATFRHYFLLASVPACLSTSRDAELETGQQISVGKAPIRGE